MESVFEMGGMAIFPEEKCKTPYDKCMYELLKSFYTL